MSRRSRNLIFDLMIRPNYLGSQIVGTIRRPGICFQESLEAWRTTPKNNLGRSVRFSKFKLKRCIEVEVGSLVLRRCIESVWYWQKGIDRGR